MTALGDAPGAPILHRRGERITEEVLAEQYVVAARARTWPLRIAYRDAGAVVDVFSPADVPGLKEHPLFFGTWDGMPRPMTDRPDVVGVFPGSGGGKSLLL